ncbi:MAG TPA: DUF58 domain-containing protein [Planctomycetia bacterium]|jgi:uncharacterized protein (DUF58 family)|nr:DUF58 domain-containing protein [Planctomycetia bacterium]
MAESLLSPDFLSRLEQLELATRKVLVGRLKGDRRSKRKGSSVEFADHRPYVMGDDLRFIDWNVMIRLDKLFLKLFEEEEDLHVHILVDSSKSMDFGDPKKLDYAKKIAAALAFVGLRNNDRVAVSAFGGDLLTPLPAVRGRHLFFRVQEYLGRIEPADDTDLTKTCKSFALKAPGRGIAVLISDLMDKNGFEVALRYLLAKHMEIYVIHILAKEEIDPPLVGDLQLVDCEDHDRADVTISAPLLKRYKANLDAFCAQARDFCVRRGIVYLFSDNQTPFETLVLRWLRDKGLLR